MPRLPRLVHPGSPHHVTQRGSRRLQVFSGAADYRSYLELLRERCAFYDVSVWCYCLMPNHVHLIATPRDARSLSHALANTHKDYAFRINRREGWKGHLWQERFYSCPLDERHLLAATRYVLLNPVRAGLVRRAQDWPYSSCQAHLSIDSDPVVDPDPLWARIREWSFLLDPYATSEEEIDLRAATRRGRWNEGQFRQRRNCPS